MNDITDSKLPRKERERQGRRREILLAAREVFAVRGFTNATLEEIADRAEFGKGTLYHYFSNKEDLFISVMTEIFDGMIVLAESACEREDAPAEELYRELAERMLRYMHENAAMYALMMQEFHQLMARSSFVSFMPQLSAILARPLRREVERGERAPLPLEETAALLFSSVLTLFRVAVLKGECLVVEGEGLHLRALPPEEREEAVRRALETLDATILAGLRAERRP